LEGFFFFRSPPIAAPVGNVYSGGIAANGNQTPAAIKVSEGCNTFAVTVYSIYGATSGTTGIDAQIAYSIDGGISYSDFASLGITTAPSGVNPSQTVAWVKQQPCTHIKFKLINKDATNAATDVEVLVVFPKAASINS
jgi:hypothetical protein